MFNKYLFLILIFVSTLQVKAQVPDTCDCKKNKPTILPLAMIGVGTILYSEGSLDKAVQKWRNEQYPTYRTHIDDYLVYAPIVATYALHFAGIKGTHTNTRQLTSYVGTSVALTAGTTLFLKNTIRRERPDLSTRNSFPSGHTASAFCFATILHKEFRKKSIWYSIGGYGVATGIAGLRVMNNRHWFSDVCTGAGLGILCTELSYRWLDRVNKKRAIQQKKPFF